MTDKTLMDHCEEWLTMNNNPVFPRGTFRSKADYEKWIEYAFGGK